MLVVGNNNRLSTSVSWWYLVVGWWLGENTSERRNSSQPSTTLNFQPSAYFLLPLVWLVPFVKSSAANPIPEISVIWWLKWILMRLFHCLVKLNSSGVPFSAAARDWQNMFFVEAQHKGELKTLLGKFSFLNRVPKCSRPCSRDNK